MKWILLYGPYVSAPLERIIQRSILFNYVKDKQYIDLLVYNN